jgi:DNA (cytosine-5)-methyltransferase 1
MAELKILSLFSGIGSFEKSLSNLNIDYDLIGFSEIDKYAATAYSTIHNINKSFNLGDINKINYNELDDFDLMTYGFPCQDVSAIGKQAGFEEDSNTRSSLLWKAMEIAKYKNPKYLVAENVKNLVQKKFKNDFEKWLKYLDEMGYNSHWKVLNAKDYGIPQNRERVFVISIRKDVDQDFKFPEPVPLKGTLDTYLEKDASLPILHNIYGGFKEDTARVFDEYSPTIRTSAGGGHIPSVVIKDSFKNLEQYIGEGYKVVLKNRGEWRVRKEDITTCIDANYYKGIDNHAQRTAIFDGHYAIRQLTPLESFRLMGFSDVDFYKVKETLNNTYYNGRDRSKSRLYKLAGNSIVVDVLEEIFKELLLK